MNAPRRQVLLLAALLVVLASLIVFRLLSTGARAGSPDRAATSRAARGALSVDSVAPAAPSTRRGRRDEKSSFVLDVNLARLDADVATPIDSGRNPFQFGSDPAPASSAPPTVAPPIPTPATPVGPPSPPPPPPIPFKFIGIVEGKPRPGKVAVLSDGRAVVHGREGDIVEGRYRIVKIGEESIQMEHIDGSGRQTIRLSGSS
jgi:hypothetical protein